MAKLWLTDKAYSLWAYVIRIGYWLVVIYLSMIVFLGLGRYLDHFLKTKEK